MTDQERVELERLALAAARTHHGAIHHRRHRLRRVSWAAVSTVTTLASVVVLPIVAAVTW